MPPIRAVGHPFVMPGEAMEGPARHHFERA